MKIVVDDKIPYIREALSVITGDTVYINGSDISSEDVKDADALIIRTRTRCDRHLLEGSKVRFIATATIGYDHIDTDYLDRAGITWTNCPGCNAGSVAQYVGASLILLRREGIIGGNATIGIVGYGHVGSKVEALSRDMGFKTMVCDPPIEAGEADACIVPIPALHPLSSLAECCDVITFHVPLTRTGRYPTYHIADAAFFRSLMRRPVVINTSRGGVVDEEALLQALDGGAISEAVIDTWEKEPDINRHLLNKVYIGTPHIAGYSADGKVNADNMVIDALCRFFGVEKPPLILPPYIERRGCIPERGTDDYRLFMYNPVDDSRRLKASPSTFEQQRGNYPVRRETI